MEQEYVDLVDADDRIIKPHMTIEEAYVQKDYFLRGVNLLIVNSEGRLWIPRRQKHKRTFPGALDFSAGGHVQSGEDYITWLARETLEEINLVIDPNKLKFIHRVNCETDAVTGIHFHANAYEYRYDGPITLNPDDISEAYWLSPAELKAKLLSPEEPEVKTSLTMTLEEHYLG